MHVTSHNLLLADDDMDDCIFFREAMDELPVSFNLITVGNGAELMQLLSNNPDNLPDILFLDLNMPRKTGFECLVEIKANDNLKHLPVIIFSTSLDQEVVNLLYQKGAHYYIQKPGEFSQLKKVIHEAVVTTFGNDVKKPSKENFILQP